MNGTSINKLIFGKIMAVGLFCYLIPMPIFFQRSPSIRHVFNRLAVPIPRIQHTLAILGVVILVETSRATKRGEITEFAITSLVLLMFLNPLNLTTFRRPEKIVEQKKTLETPLVPCQGFKLRLSVIPAQAGIQIAALDFRLRGNDEPENQELTRQ